MLGVYPNYTHDLIRRGVMELNSGRIAEALKLLGEAVCADPGYAPSRLVLASTYNDLHRYRDALDLLSKSSPVLAELWQSHFEMARALYGMADYAAALGEVTEALRFASRQGTAGDRAFLHYVRADLLLQLGSADAAKEEFELTLKEDPNGDLGTFSRDALDRLETPMR